MSDTPTPRTNELDASGASYNDMLAQTRTLETELTAANARIAELDRMSSDLVGEIEKQREEKESLTRQLSEAREGWHGALSKVDDANRQLSEAQTRISEQAKYISELREECFAVNQKLSESQAQLAAAREDGERKFHRVLSEALDIVLGHHEQTPTLYNVEEFLRSAIDSARGCPMCGESTPSDDCPVCAQDQLTSPPASAEPGPAAAIAQDFCPNCGSQHYCTGPGAILEDGVEQRGCENCGWRWEFRLPPPPTQDGKEQG